MPDDSRSTGDNFQILPAPSEPLLLPVHLQDLTNRAHGVCRGGQFHQHPQGLCLRLEAFYHLVSLSSPPVPQTVDLYITACASDMPLAPVRAAPRRIRFRRSTPALLPFLELCAARAHAWSQGPAYRQPWMGGIRKSHAHPLCWRRRS